MALSDFYSERAAHFSFRLRNIRKIRTMPTEDGFRSNSADYADYAYTTLKIEMPKANTLSPSGRPHPHEREAVEKNTAKDTAKSGEARLDRDRGTSEELRKNSGSTASVKPERSPKAGVQGDAEIIRKPSFMPLTDADLFWLQKRLEAPSLLSPSDLVGLRLARHYAEGGEAVSYKHPLAYLPTDGIPERFRGNRELRAALAMNKYPSALVCVRTDAAGHDYWDATARGMELYHRFSDRFGDYTACRWFQRAMSGDVMPKRLMYGDSMPKRPAHQMGGR